MDQLLGRLGLSGAQLQGVDPAYREFTIPKRSGGQRHILAPTPALRAVQRTILRRLLNKLKVHPAAVGFQRGESFVTNARRHCQRAVVVRLDVRDFFASISAPRVEGYFRAIGWNRTVARRLTQLCTWDGKLPPGAPTSPRLSNLVNYELDARLAGLVAAYNARLAMWRGCCQHCQGTGRRLYPVCR